VRRALPGDRGQATVEFALVLPVIVLVVMLVLQVGLVVREQVLVSHAAREGARAAAVSDADRVAAARTAVERAAALDAQRLTETVLLLDGGRTVRVTVGYRSVTDLPLIGLLVPDVDLDATVVMQVESSGEHRS
jgi:Flp pilus assembly protein TadG